MVCRTMMAVRTSFVLVALALPAGSSGCASTSPSPQQPIQNTAPPTSTPEPRSRPESHGTFGKDDRDGDGILDTRDMCPDDPEDFDGFTDDDGCPDPDNDADGILDIDDMCPNNAENQNGVQDDDGCPD